MTGEFIDNLRFSFRSKPSIPDGTTKVISTDYGNVRVLDSGGDKPVLLNVPDGPNVIEHHLELIKQLSKNFRVVCFEMPGMGFSYPNSKFDYSLEKAAKLTVNLLDILKVERAVLAFSCSNGLYAMKTAVLYPHRISQLFLSQTPSLKAMDEWTNSAIPDILKYPVVGQIANSFSKRKLVQNWYKFALPKETDTSAYQSVALHSLNTGGCFCLSSLVQGLKKDLHSSIELLKIPSTLIWGTKDYTHRGTDSKSILKHIPHCEIIEFEKCGHFPDLEDTDRYVSLLNERFVK